MRRSIAPMTTIQIQLRDEPSEEAALELENTVEAIDGIRRANVNRHERSVTVDHDGADVDHIAAALASAGFAVTVIRDGPDVLTPAAPQEKQV